MKETTQQQRTHTQGHRDTETHTHNIKQANTKTNIITNNQAIKQSRNKPNQQTSEQANKTLVTK